ncbi:MAG: TetR family transcriptional regulator C-terminal domain-containing protein [Phormidesmis sp.]
MVKRTRKRDDLIRVGRALIVRKGFNATGLSDVLTLAEVPKGSFYYYFESKEDFGLAIIEASAQSYQQKLADTLGNEQMSPLARLNSYFEYGLSEMDASSCEEGCLLGNLAQEMSAQNPVFRDRLNQIFSDWERHLANCLQAAYEAGELTQPPTDELASFILSSWQGAMIRSKLASSTEPLKTFTKLIFGQVLNIADMG